MTASHHSNQMHESQEERGDEIYGAGFIEYSIRTSFRDLCRVLGKPQAREIVAEIVNDEFEGKRQ